MFLSFIMPSYKAQWLEEAIESIAGQSCKDWELVIVDDCSPQDLKGIVDKFNNPRISYNRNEENLGRNNLVAQWNHAISYAKGDWIVLAADDDVYDPAFCEEILHLSSRYPNVNLIRSRVEIIGPESEHRWNDREFPEFFSCYEYLYNWLEGKVFTCVGNYAFRRKALIEAGGFMNFPHAFCSDQATPIMMAAKGVANTSGILFKFRQSDIHLSGDKTMLKDKLTAMQEFYRWLEDFEYPAPSSEKDSALYSIKNSRYLHDKCIYDCFNHAVRFAPLRDLPSYLRMCSCASPLEKAVMVARWVKRRLF